MMKKIQKLRIYYDLNKSLTNCGEQEIGANGGLAYFYSILENKKEKMKEDDINIKEKIYNKITNILPQHITT